MLRDDGVGRAHITEGVGKQKDGSVNVAPVIAYDLDRLNQLRADETKQITIKVERLDAIATAYKTKHTNEVANQVDVNLPLAIAVGNNKNRGWRYFSMNWCLKVPFCTGTGIFDNSDQSSAGSSY